ncbi:unnamed protein product [Urochloa humidicola]
MARKQVKEKGIAVLEEGDSSLPTLRADKRSARDKDDKLHELEEQVSDLFGKLKLTVKEKETLVLEDTEDSDLAVVNHAVIGKVLAPNSVQLQTIMSAMRPAWGNPRGLQARMVGDNLFIAEFESELDKIKALEGSPWYIGRQAVGRQTVILQYFNYDLRPSDVPFNELAIWVNILDLPFALRNEKWGFELARNIGKKVLKVDVDEQKRVVGKDMRVRMVIPMNEPLPRGVSVFSSRRQRKEWYNVVYEKVPYFCFSCGIIGHSDIECPTPAIRDGKGRLPYSEKLRAHEDRKVKNQGEWHAQGDSSSRKSSSAGAQGSYDSKQSVTKENEDDGKVRGKGEVDDNGFAVSSPGQNQGSKTVNRLSDEGLNDPPVHTKEIFVLSKKRKPDETLSKFNSGEEEGNNMEVEDFSMALVPFAQRGNTLGMQVEKEVVDGSKKMKKENAGLQQQPRGSQ